jgi:hypothetical protein
MVRSFLATACLVGLLGLVAIAAVATAAGAAQPRTTIATVSSADVRAVLAAQKTGSGGAPTARVTVATYARANGRWNLLRTVRVSGTYFWNVVSAPHAVCRFELATASSATVRPHVVVELLVTPSIGCGKPQTVGLPLD